MRRRTIAIVLTILMVGALVVDLAFFLSPPAARTWGYFAFAREWQALWPWESGKNLPLRLSFKASLFAPTRVRIEPHVSMLLDPNDLVSRVILETGAWEPESWLAIRSHLRPGDTFVDVGAHIGYHSLKAAAVVGPSGRVIAVEPNARTVRELQDNIRESGAESIIVQPVACSDTEGSIELFVAPRANTGQTSLSRQNASQAGSAVESYRVRARPLDAVIRESGVSRVDVIKIDVEGAELLVLKGAQGTIARYRPLLIVEIVDEQLKAMGTSSNEVISFARSVGYEPSHRIGQNIEFAFRNSSNVLPSAHLPTR